MCERALQKLITFPEIMTGVVVVCPEHDDDPSDNNDLIRDILEDKGLFRLLVSVIRHFGKCLFKYLCM